MSKRDEYTAYVQRVEADNLARDMYGGDTYMGYENAMSFAEWSRENAQDEPMTQPNQSELDKLEQKLLEDGAFQHILKFAPKSQRELMNFELARYMFAYITANYTPNSKVAEREQSLWAITYDFLHRVDRGLCDEWERAIEGGEII